MREHKYRAYDKDKKIMVYDYDQESVKDYNLQVGESIHMLVWRIGNLYETLMQYTGLKDNTPWEKLSKAEQDDWIKEGNSKESWNGKEIYEGDLLIHNGDRDAMFECFYHNWYGSFSIGRTRYKGSRCGGWIPPLSNENLEVIGNIYENPELLKL